ncbi:transcriptional regulator [Actinophytocola gossypii]|uniref:Transcriptional regulator n=1 Tax=Actinophytocola gossypii TaxID=2812003 RepID=A0ABT2JE87_9PSEU|nr:transcriptional regulator [Actinophytocola gossypii]MCT2586185.1 transcriptional regulator [Actinophytocola gossypii]
MAHGEHGQDDRSDILHVDPDAVPMLRNAFADALAKVDRQLTLADAELRVTAWAGDPVSREASVAFNERSVDSRRSAVDALRAYRDRLYAAVTNLDRTAEQYREVDGDGKANVGTKGAQ